MKTTRLSSIVSIVITLSFAVSSQAQEKDIEWQQIKSAIKIRAEKIKTCFVQGSLSHYQSTSVRRYFFEESKKNADADNILDSNEVIGFSWFNDRLKWRLDVRRVYPSIGRDFKQISFDGEEYLTYDEQYTAGSINADRLKSVTPPSWSEDDLTSFSADSLFGSGMLSNLENIWFLDTKPPAYQRKETVGNTICEKYIHYSNSTEKGVSNEVTIWFSPKDQLIIKVKIIQRKLGKSEGNPMSTVYYVVGKMEVFSNVSIPTEIKIESYAAPIPHTSYSWLTTEIFKASKVQVNDPNSVSAFSNNVRVTARIVDTLEDPGKFQQLGGDLDEEAAKVRLGVPPPLEEPGIVANGTAPEVAEAQQKLEKKPGD